MVDSTTNAFIFHAEISGNWYSDFAITEIEIITVDFVEFEMNRTTYHKLDYLHSGLETLNPTFQWYMPG